VSPNHNIANHTYRVRTKRNGEKDWKLPSGEAIKALPVDPTPAPLTSVRDCWALEGLVCLLGFWHCLVVFVQPLPASFLTRTA
jgi:hypothetical protein